MTIRKFTPTLLLSSLVLLGFLAFHTSRANAATAVSGSALTTTPISVDLSGKPGSPVSTTLQVQNNGTKPTTIKLSVYKFSASGTTGQPKIASPLAGDPSVGWVHFSRNDFVAQPGVFVPVTMTVDLPYSATLGYYYAILFTPNTSVKGLDNNEVTNIKGSNAVLVLLDTHSSNEQRALTIQKFSTSRKIYQYLPAKFNIEIKNAGNIYAVPQGDVYISRSASSPKVIDTLDFNPNSGNVLPDSSRDFQVSWSDGFPHYEEKKVNGQIITNKKGVAEQTLSWSSGQTSKFRFGKYYAHLVLVYSNGNRDIPINSVVSFWVIPWTFVFIFLVFLVIVGFGVWTIIKPAVRRIKKPVKSTQSAAKQKP